MMTHKQDPPSRKALLYAELAYDPDVEARYGDASRARMAGLHEKLATMTTKTALIERAYEDPDDPETWGPIDPVGLCLGKETK